MPAAADAARWLTPYAFVAAAALWAAERRAERRAAPVPPLVADAIRAVAALVAVAAAYVHARYDCRDVLRFYARAFPQGTPRAAMVATEVLAHFLPPLLIGPPRTPIGVALGYAIVAAWYAAVARASVRRLYLDNVPVADYDRLIYRVLPLAGAAWSAALLAARPPPPPLPQA